MSYHSDGTYTIEETSAPAGYKTAAPQTITIEKGAVKESQPVILIDELYQTDIAVSKQDTAGNEIGGAVLKLTASDNTFDLSELGVTATQGTATAKNLSVSSNSVVFETMKDSKTVIRNLPDGTYTLEETTVPSGYQKADPVTIVIEKGVLTSPASIVMVDKNNQTDVTIDSYQGR